MRTVILYHPKSDHVGIVEEYMHDYKRFKGGNIEPLSLDTRDGDDMAKLYDITNYPALLVIEPDGTLAHVWQTGLLPLMDELYAYAGGQDTAVSHEGKKILAPTT